MQEKTTKSIYVSSSWRNPYQPNIVEALQAEGYNVYDFRHPEPGDDGFQWSEIDPNWKSWSVQSYLTGLQHPAADSGFGKDMRALDRCDAVVLLLPCGKSAHLEAGYAAGQGKPVVIFLCEFNEPELMYKMATAVVATLPDLLDSLEMALEGVAA